MRGFWGLMRAYWFSDQWQEAWALTAAVAVITIVSNKTGVWLTKAAGELANSIAYFHLASNKTALASVLTSAGMLVLIVILKDLGIAGALRLCNATLHRKWRSWLNGRFNGALLDTNHTHYHVQHGGRGQDGRDMPPPDNIDQRVHESIKDMTGGAIGLASGAFGAVSALVIYGYELVKMSQPVAGFAFLGDYGFAVLAFAAVAIYVPLNTYVALKIGKLLERLNTLMQKAEGSYRAELTTFLRRSFHVAASNGEAVQTDMHSRLYSDIDRTWARQNWLNTGYAAFEFDLRLCVLPHCRLRARIAALYVAEAELQGLHYRRGNGEPGHPPVFLVHPCHAGNRVAEGQCAADDRPCRCD